VDLNVPSGGGASVAASSPLRRRATPPGAFERTIIFGGMGPGDADACEFLPPADRVAHPGFAECIAELNQPMDLTFDGFASGSEVALEAFAPDGTRIRAETSVADVHGVAKWHWISVPSDPLGDSTLSASQGSLKSTAQLRVEASSQPRRAVLPAAGAPGTTFHFYVAGMQARQRVELSLYRGRKIDEFPFVTSLGAVITDERGNAMFELPTAPDDPWNEYVIDTIPPAGLTRGGRFSLTAPAAVDPQATKLNEVPRQIPAPTAEPPCLGPTVRPGAQPINVGALEIGQDAVLCLTGFAAGQKVYVDTVAGNGSQPGIVQSGSVDASGNARLGFTYLVGLQPGVYQLEFKNDVGFGRPAQAKATIELRKPSKPRVFPASLSSYTTDPSIAVGLVGFSPYETVRLDVYRRAECNAAEGCWSYISSTPRTAVDEFGNLSRDILLGRGAPSGEYRVLTDPPAASGSQDRFTIAESETSILARAAPAPAGIPPSISAPASPAGCLGGAPLIAGKPRNIGEFEWAEDLLPVCLEGFQPREQLNIQEATPDRRSSSGYTVTTDADGKGRFQLLVTYYDAPGVYTLSLKREGVAQPIGQYSVKPASRPRIVVLTSVLGSNWPSYFLSLAGFKPRQSVAFHLYQMAAAGAACSAARPCFTFRSALDNVEVGDNGAAHFALSLNEGDPMGTYAILSVPGNLVARFDVPPPQLRTAAVYQDELRSFVASELTSANKTWAEAVARNGDLSKLEYAFGGNWLEEVRASIQRMRGAGQYRVARLLSPITVQKVERFNNRHIEADVHEEWDDALFNSTGGLVHRLPGRVDQHYVLEPDGLNWKVVESTVKRQN
jgi:hypothetical protein